MATIYTIVGEYDLAIDELEYVLSIPAWCLAEYLMGDPIYAPLHDNLRFKVLVKKYAKE